MHERMQRRTPAAVRILAIAATLAGSAHAETRNVPAQHATIQAAIDAAQPGDVVLVAPGIYSELIDFHGKGIEVRSSAGPAQTVIDGAGVGVPQGGRIVVRMDADEPESALFEGFTVRNGTGATTCCHAGGLQCLGCRATIRGNVFENNSGWNGAITVLSSGWPAAGGAPAEPVIEGNTFEGNTAFVVGGAAGCYRSRPTFVGNVFRDNEAIGDAWSDSAGPAGGALAFNEAPEFIVTGNEFVGNRAQHAGGAIFAIVSDGGRIEDNRFQQNESRSGGAVMLEKNRGLVTVKGNVFYENRAAKIEALGTEDDTYGGALATFSTPVDLFENRFVRNHGTSPECPRPASKGQCAFGGAVALFGDSVRIERNLLAHNDSDWAGAMLLGNDDPGELNRPQLVGTVRDNLVTWSVASESIAGILCQEGAQCSFDRNEIHDSRVPNTDPFNGSAGGGVTFVRSGQSAIANSFLAGNRGQFGGAISVMNSPVTIRNNTIAESQGLFVLGGPPTPTGSVWLSGPPLDADPDLTPILENNLFLANPNLHVREAQNVTPASVRSNLFSPTGSIAWYNIAEGPPLSAAGVNDLAGVDADGNFEGDPNVAFAGPCRRYALPAASIAIDAGDAARAALPFDLEGEARSVGVSVDVGADERHEPGADACAGAASVAFYRPSTNVFYLDTDGDGQLDQQLALGRAGDLPVVGHFAGPFADGVGVYVPASGRFDLDFDRDGVIDRSRSVNATGGVPVVGDWDGDGDTDLGVFDSAAATFSLDPDGDGMLDESFVLGQPGDRPLVGDWDADGRSDVGVYRPSASAFLLDADRSGVADTTLAFGPPDRMPVVGDWNGDGVGDVGVLSDATLAVDFDGDGAADWSRPLGEAGDLPISGIFVPEPATPFGVAATIAALAGLARRREA